MIRETVPENLLIFSWLLWLMFWLLTPGTYHEITPLIPAVPILIAYNLSLFLGFKLAKKKNYEKRSTTEVSRKVIQQLLYIILAIGTIGVMLRLSQRLSTGFSFSVDITENRMSSLKAEEGSGGILSIFAAILYPFSFLALMVVVYFKQYFNRLIYIGTIILGLFPLLDSLALGGRSVLFFQGIALFILFQHRQLLFPSKYIKKKIRFQYLRVKKFKFFLYRKNWVNAKTVFIGIVGLYLMSVFFIQIQKSRTNRYGDSIPWEQAVKFVEEGRLLKYNDDVRTEIIKGDNSLGYLAQLTIVHYGAHGVFEYIRWVNNIDNIWGEHKGKYQFYVFVKFFKILGVDTGDDFMTMTNETGRVGVFTTFWGPVYIDFGIFGTIYALFLGFFIKTMYFRAMNKNLLGMLIYPFLGAMIFSISVINTIVGQNMYYFPAILLSYLLYRFLIIVNTKKNSYAN